MYTASEYLVVIIFNLTQFQQLTATQHTLNWKELLLALELELYKQPKQPQLNKYNWRNLQYTVGELFGAGKRE